MSRRHNPGRSFPEIVPGVADSWTNLARRRGTFLTQNPRVKPFGAESVILIRAANIMNNIVCSVFLGIYAISQLFVLFACCSGVGFLATPASERFFFVARNSLHSIGGFFLVVLIPQNLVYLGMPIRISAWLLLGGALVQVWLCRESLSPGYGLSIQTPIFDFGGDDSPDHRLSWHRSSSPGR